MRWHIKRSKLLFALFPLISIVFFIFTANSNLYAEQSFMAFDIYQRISDVMTPVEGKDSPSDYTAAENFAIAAGVYLNTDSVQSTTVGSAVALGGFYTQNVNNFRSKTGGELFQESISLSAIVSLAEQRYFKDGALLYRKGNASGGKLKSWSDEITELSDAVYRQRYGIIPQEITKYSVTQNSIISGKFVSSTDDTFTYELVLDADEAWKYSQYEMMTYAGTTKYPEFDSCRLVFTVDSAWRILEIQMYDVYSVNVSVGNVKCNSSLTETFTYLDGYMPERAQPFIDYVPTGNTTGSIDTEKGPADYLGEAYGDYISGEKVLYADAIVSIMGEDVKVTAAVDVKNNDYRFTVGDNIFAAYKNDTLYVSLGQNKYYVKTSDLTPLLELFGLNLGGEEDGGLSDTAILDVLFENHEITETDTHVNIRMPFELMGMGVDINMGLKKLDDGTTAADTITATANLGDLSVNVNASIVNYIALPELNESDYSPLMPIIDSVVNTASSKTFKADVSGEISYDGAKEEFTASVILDARDALKAQGSLTVSEVTAEFAYTDNTVYVKLNDLGFKLDLNNASGLLDSVIDAYGSVDGFINNLSDLLGEQTTAEIKAVLASLDEIIGKLGETPDANEIINNLSFVLPELSVSGVFALIDNLKISDSGISVTVIPQSGSPYNVSVSMANGYVSGASISGLNANGLTVNLNAKLTCGEDYDISVTDSDYIDLAVISEIMPAVKSFLNANVFALDLNGEITSEYVSGNIIGNIEFSLNPLKIKANLSFGETRLTLYFEGENVYAQLGGIKLKYALKDTEELKALIGKYFPTAANASQIAQSAAESASLIQSALGGKTLGELLSVIKYVTYNDGKLGVSVVYNGISVAASLSFTENSISLNSCEFAYSDVISGKVNATLSVKDGLGDFTVNADEYVDAMTLIRTVVNTIEYNAYKIDLSGSVESGDLTETFTGAVTLTLGESLAVAGAIRVSGVTVEFVYANDTVYLQAEGIALKLSVSEFGDLLDSVSDIAGGASELVENISALIGESAANKIIAALNAVNSVLGNISLGDGKPDISGILSSADFMLPELSVSGIEKLIGGIEITDSEITVNVQPVNGAEYSVTVTYGNGLITGASVSGLTVKGITVNLSAALTCGGQYDISVDESEYADLAAITRLAPALSSLLKSNVIELDVTSGLLNSSVVSGMISGKAYVSLNPLCLAAELTFRTHNVSLRYENDIIYVAVNDIRIKFATSDIDSLINEISKYVTIREAATVAEVITEGLKYTSLIQNALGGKTLADIISCVTYMSDYDNGGITAVFSVGDFNASVNLYANGTSLTIDAYNVNYGADIYDSSLCVTLTPLNAMPALAFDEDSYVNLAEIQSYIAPVMNTLRQRYFSLTFGGGVLDRKNEATSISGQLKAELTEGFANIYVNILLGGKTGDQSIELYLLDTTDYDSSDKFDILNLTAYVNYNNFIAKIDSKSALRIVGAIRNILNLNVPMLDELLSGVTDETLDTSVFETLEIAGLDDLRNALNSVFSLAGNIQGGASGGISGLLGLVSDAMLDSILSGVSLQFEDSLLKISIDNGLFDGTLSGKKASVVIGHDGELLTYVSIANLIANGDTVNFTANLSCEEFDRITPPESNNIKDFTSLDELLFTVIKTASLREFEITGEINLNLLGLVKPEIPFDIKVKILDDGSTVAAVKLEVPYKVGGMLKRTNSYIYFVNDMLYFVVDVWNNGAFSAGSYKSTEMKSATIEEFLSAPIDYLFYLIRMADLAESQIKNAISGAGGGTPSTDLNQILKTYSYADNKYTFKIGLKELSGSSDLNDLNLTLSATPDGYVSGLALDTQFTSMNITLALNNTKLSNLELNPDGTVSGTKDLGYVDFGLSGAASTLNNSYAIDNLEDAMAVLFPVEAAETFGVKAAKKADKAADAAANAIIADNAVSKAEADIQTANDALNAAREKLASIPEGSFGYARAEAQVKLAEQAARNAEDAYSAAIQNRIIKAQEAIDASASAYYYAEKAAEFAQTASEQNTVRGYAAAGSAAQASVYAIQSAKDALNAAVTAATNSGEDGTEILTKAQNLLNEINESIPQTATKAARAALIACRQTATEAVTLSDRAASYADAGDWFAASQYASDALDTINAMITAINAAENAAALSGDGELIAEIAESANNVNAVLEHTVTKTANAAVSAANAIAANGKTVIDAALAESKDGNCESATLKTKEALTYAEKAIIAARGATSAAMLIDDESISQSAQQAADAATSAAEYIGNSALGVLSTAIKSYAETINTAEDLSGLTSAAETLNLIGGLIDTAATAKQYATNNVTAVMQEISTVAAKAANSLLRRANIVLYSAAVNYADSVNTAANNALNKSFGTTAYSDVQNYSNAITNAANGISSIAPVFQTAVNAVNDIYSKTYALLSDEDYAEFYALLTETLTGDSGLESASALLQSAAISAQNGSAKMVTASNSLKWSASDFFGTAMNNAKSAATDCESAANSAKESADSTVESANTLISLYNGLSR